MGITDMQQRTVIKIEWDNKCKLPNVLVNALINKTKFPSEYIPKATIFDFPQIHENINCSSLFWESRF